MLKCRLSIHQLSPLCMDFLSVYGDDKIKIKTTHVSDCILLNIWMTSDEEAQTINI